MAQFIFNAFNYYTSSAIFTVSIYSNVLNTTALNLINTL